MLPDLTDAVTVFVATIGAETFPACLEHLAHQDCTFRTEVIHNVAPASAAFQQMLDRCRTPAYVQVDEDMLLFPFAIRTLHQALSRAPARVAVTVGRLFDYHLGEPIEGVKIFRHSVAAAHP